MKKHELSELELYKLSMYQILIFRSLASAELKEEMEKRKAFIEERNQLKQEENKDSIFSNQRY